MKIDIICFSKSASKKPISWRFGNTIYLSKNDIDEINSVLKNVDADYVYFCNDFQQINKIFNILETSVDILHAGDAHLKEYSLFELHMLINDWHLILGSKTNKKVSWFLHPVNCLIKVKTLRSLGYLDKSFNTIDAAFFEFGYRSFKSGYIIMFEPELKTDEKNVELSLGPQDIYLFILKHWGHVWMKYIYLRRIMKSLKNLKEFKFLSKYIKPYDHSFAKNYEVEKFDDKGDFRYEVIIPTIGRYDYLPKAIDSMINQSIKPSRIIVVDQNGDDFQKQIYKDYDSSLVKVIKQKNRSEFSKKYWLKIGKVSLCFLFDDDSIYETNLIYNHISSLIKGKFDLSTGVSYPPNDANYKLPIFFANPKLSTMLDTGNTLIPMSIFKNHGGLDRNYDFGPGTDTDLGTRIFLNGYRILHNPNAKRIHFKAPVGGLRKFNSHKYNTDLNIFSAFPPVTQYYYGLRYLTGRQLFERILLQYFKSKFPNKHNSFLHLVLSYSSLYYIYLFYR